MGEIYKGKLEGVDSHWVLLTPSCDLIESRPKAENVILAGCKLLSTFKEYTSFIENKSNTSKINL